MPAGRRRQDWKRRFRIWRGRLIVRPFVSVIVNFSQRVQPYYERQSPDKQDECLDHLSGTFVGAATRFTGVVF